MLHIQSDWMMGSHIESFDGNLVVNGNLFVDGCLMSPSILANSLGVSKVFFWTFSSKESNSGGFPTGLPSYKISGHCNRKHLFHTLMAHTKRNTRVFTQCIVFV